MKTTEQSQDPLFIEENPFVSYLYLSHAVYPFLTKAETNIMEALWQRTSRFGIIGHTVLTYKHVNEGSGSTEPAFPDTENEQVWPGERFPIYEDMTDRHFKRCKGRLETLGLIQKHGGIRSYYRISCYPRDYVDRAKRLISALSQDESTTGYSILREISRMTETLRRFKKL